MAKYGVLEWRKVAAAAYEKLAEDWLPGIPVNAMPLKM